MRRIAYLLLALAAVGIYWACSADAPAPTPPKEGGPGPSGANPLQVRLFTGNPNPTAGSCTLIQAIVTLNGVNVPDGTGVSLSNDFGVFQQNNLPVISVTTQNGAALTAVCSTISGIAVVRASVTVGSNTATSTITISFQPQTQSAPFFTFCSPSFGSANGGTTLTIDGGRFFGSASTTRVTFTAAGVTREGQVTGLTVQAVTLTSAVTVITPAFPEATSPTVPVTITLTLGANTASPVTLSIPNCFAYGTAGSSTPTITAILPSSGPNEGGTRVTIIGSGFSAPLQVFFGPVEAQVLSITYNQIVALTPAAFGAGAPNLNATVEVRVHEVNTGVDATLGSAFRFVPKVLITSVNNNQQRVDLPFDPVTIFGQGFQAPVAASLANIAVPTNGILSVSATEIVVLPARPQIAGCTDISGPVSVVNINSGDGDTKSNFTYLVAQTKPLIFSVSPASGPPGSTVTISGANLRNVTNVRIGSRSANFTISGNSILATVPDPGGSPPTCPAGVTAGTLVNGAIVDVTVTDQTTTCSSSATGAFLYQLPCTSPPPTPTPLPPTPIPTSTAPADLLLTKTANPTTIAVGSNITFNFVIRNIGLSPAASVTLTDVLPAGFTFFSCSTTQGSCTPGSTVTAAFGTIGPGAFANMSVVATAGLPTGSRTNTATVSTTSAESDLTNNISTVTFTVTP